MSKYRIVKNEIKGQDIYYTIEKKFLFWWLNCPITFCKRVPIQSRYNGYWYNDFPLDRVTLELKCIKFKSEQDAKIQLEKLNKTFYEEYNMKAIIVTVIDENTWKEVFVDLLSEEYLFKHQWDKGYKYANTLQELKNLVDSNEPKLIKRTVVN